MGAGLRVSAVRCPGRSSSAGFIDTGDQISNVAVCLGNQYLSGGQGVSSTKFAVADAEAVLQIHQSRDSAVTLILSDCNTRGRNRYYSIINLKFTTSKALGSLQDIIYKVMKLLQTSKCVCRLVWNVFRWSWQTININPSIFSYL